MISNKKSSYKKKEKRKGTTIACLRQLGNIPEHNIFFTISTLSGITQYNCSFNNLVGTGSKSQ